MNKLNRFLAHSDADWAFHRVMDSYDRDAFDRALVRIKHPLAYEAGTQEGRFKALARSGFQFSDEPDTQIVWEDS